MTVGGSKSRTKATPQVAAAMMGSIALGAGWAVTGSWWRAAVVGVVAGAGGYVGQRWSLLREKPVKP